MSDDEKPFDPRQVDRLAAIVSAQFHGVEAQVVGATLAELLSRWLAMHPAEMVRDLLAMHMRTVGKLEPENRRILDQNLARMGGNIGSATTRH